jgi:DNA-binding response OmpR family regulator
VTPETILLVEDDPNISAFLVEAIAQETPYRAIVASDSHAALKLVRRSILASLFWTTGCRV